jgi:hypothetical protein
MVTSGILIDGGKGLSFGGQNPIWTVIPIKGMVNLMHNGFGAGNGVMTKVGDDPWELVIVVFEILINSVVWTGGAVMYVDDPLSVNQNGIGVHVVVVVIGGNKIVQGKVQ